MVLKMKYRLKNRLTIFVLLFLLSLNLKGQQNLLRYADIEFELMRYEHAGSQYVKAFKKRSSYYSAKRAAESFSYIKSYEKAYVWWGKVVSFKESTREDYLNYARSVIESGRRLVEAGVWVTEEEMKLVYSGVVVPDDETIELKSLSVYNGKSSDYGLSKDEMGNTYFVSDRGPEIPTSKPMFRFDARNRYNGALNYKFNDRGFHRIFRDFDGEIRQVGVELSGVYHLSMPSFFVNKGKQEVIFTAVLQENRLKKGRRQDFYPGLYRAEVKSDGSFGSVRALPFNNLSEYGVMHGVVHKNRVYFSSDKSGGYGGFDIYYADILEEGYGEPVNMGSIINGPGHEVFPYVYDGELFFSSDRLTGIGGLDIYKTDLNLRGVVKNLGRPFNSIQDDFAYFVDGSGMQYISSDRGMSESRDDIYSIAYLYDKYRIKVFAENGERLDVMDGLEFVVKDARGNTLPFEIKDGALLGLKEGDYSIQVKRKGYFPIRMPIFAGSPDGMEKFIDYKMISIPYNSLLSLDTIYYNFDKYNIRPDAADKLDRVSVLLGWFPEFNLNITSHTDVRGSMPYNERLSENRSKSAASYLYNKGIDRNRISMGWKGKTQLMTPCTEGVDCPELEHEKNRRSMLSLELYPDKELDYELPPGLDYVESTEELAIALERMVREKQSLLMPEIIGEDILYYDLDSYVIRKDGEEVLMRAIGLLEKYPFMKIEISSHTDSRQSIEYNDRLSKNRSTAVFMYLRKNGIDPNRMSLSWYSKLKAAVPCNDDECSEEQHQLNRRTVLKLYVNKMDKDKVIGKLSFEKMLLLSEDSLDY
jgi:outer membrane protein OmpA-like peptidoglycan-associated protein